MMLSLVISPFPHTTSKVLHIAPKRKKKEQQPRFKAEMQTPSRNATDVVKADTDADADVVKTSEV